VVVRAFCRDWRQYLVAVRPESVICLVFIAHGRRELVHLNVTANPTAAWVWRQLIEATPWGHKPRQLLHDHAAVHGRAFRRRARRMGSDAIATPIASPRADAVIERFIGTLRRACLGHLIILDEQHLRSVLTEFIGYSNLARPHRTLRLETPLPVTRPAEGSQCAHGRCSEACITCTSEQPDRRADFCAPTGRHHVRLIVAVRASTTAAQL
jgi:transposase InsO family protein